MDYLILFSSLIGYRIENPHWFSFQELSSVGRAYYIIGRYNLDLPFQPPWLEKQLEDGSVYIK